eukprot:gnl/MRDRNA2_/MRDRNA2_27163_c0_seq1.p1 gnl/MRDRNA2_/MRDRNA2_27163_c0~~gnl/MRDRNA2_/MRDRNA2_27163_c0_seq1.p1  ORF type:complete len:488 (+),score=61.79 gnl/MRDRNA2_/MRDRNA2_27163_c0_seq1:104-1567(+)
MQGSKFQEVLAKVSRAVNAPFKGAKEPVQTLESDSDNESFPPMSPRQESDSDNESFRPIRPRQNILRRCDSAFIMRTNNHLRREFPNKNISPRIIFDNPTIEGITHKLCEDMSDGSPDDAESGCDTDSLPEAPPLGNIQNAWPISSQDLKLQPFTQLVVSESELILNGQKDVLEPYEAVELGRYFRRRDGMECILIPAGTATIGTDSEECSAIEGPSHRVELSSFLMDIEPVSIGAYVRFLNATLPCGEALLDFCLLLTGDDRDCHLPVHYNKDTKVWCARPGVPLSWPMILVSWYGANAYSLWVHGHDWRAYKDAEHSFLPTETQWEYAARGAKSVRFPWGEGPASPKLLNVCWDISAHDPESHISTPLEEFPLVPVNAEIGMSPFGLRGMAGNVWQWCRDVYDPHFYQSPEASHPNAWNKAEEGPKVEKGGSWVGPADLARSSYRRGRLASAKGRCLGFRCVGDASLIPCSDENSTRASSDDGTD